MYAVIRAGGKQYKVAEGDVIEVELIGQDSGTVEFEPLLVVDDKGNTTVAGDLAKASVTAEVLGEGKWPKIHVYKYKNKTRYRRHTGHRQRFSSLRIAGISTTGSKAAAKPKAAAEPKAKAATPKEGEDGS